MAYNQLAHDKNYFLMVNRERKKLGLTPVEKKPRNCLRCEKKFMSIGRGNFMCLYCATKASETYYGE